MCWNPHTTYGAHMLSSPFTFISQRHKEPVRLGHCPKVTQLVRDAGRRLLKPRSLTPAVTKTEPEERAAAWKNHERLLSQEMTLQE